MALRDQPYIPFYVDDYLTDEKLNMCSAATQGVYIKILCIMHKSDNYGKILLKQKDKQNESQTLNFADKIAKMLPFRSSEIQAALNELIEEGVLNIEDNFLTQKRMVKDNELSLIRSKAGQKGGKKTQSKNNNFVKAKNKATTVNEDVNENVSVINNKRSEIIFPFDSDDFKEMWNHWKIYKKEEFKFRFKSEQSEQAQLTQLSNLANGNEQTAIKILHQSMANGWKGLFEIKETNGKQTTKGLGEYLANNDPEFSNY